MVWSRALGLLGPSIMLLLLVWIGFRITQGVDLSDESYYAVFLDTWLKEGIRASPFLSLHQTAALLVYPPALLFWRLTGSTDGLILFLRAVYVLASLSAALSATAVFRRVGETWTAWLAGALVLAFIPFGLPAPSYNTLGEQATIAAVAGCGCAVLDCQARLRTYAPWLVCSALAWAVATVAYPSLVLAIAVLFACLFMGIRGLRPMLLSYVGLVLGFQLAAWSCVVSLLTWTRIRDSISYQSSIAGSFDFAKKLSLILDVFLQNYAFSGVAATAILIGLFRTRLHLSTASIATGALLVAILLFPSALFVHSHDAVLLAALSGLGLLGNLCRSEVLSSRILAIMYAVSLSAGAATAATATYALFAFPIGGLFAAIIAVLIPPGSRGDNRLTIVPGAALLGLFIWCSALFYYGEQPNERKHPRKRIAQGAFSGLVSSAETAQLIEVAQAGLEKWAAPGATFAAVGRLPGLYLLTKAYPRALTPFPLTRSTEPSGLAATYDYYANPANRPAIVAIYTDAYFEPINPFGPQFHTWYELVQQDPTPVGMLDIFRRQ